MQNATHLGLINQIHEPSGLSVAMFRDVNVAPIGWGSLIRATESPLPDPTVTGPCLVQATFGCAKEAAGERLIPTSMLPDALIPGPLYAPMCLPCYEHLSTVYLTTLHQGERP